ncbi:LytTr DNA-binding domain protein [compost metagenome]
MRVHTREGSSLVLMPMGQAIAAAGEVEGLRVHRSWWVARHAVQGVVKDGRNLRLRLISGQEAPIARAKVALLKTAGWLSAD